MSDHVALSFDQISQSEQRSESGNGNQGGRASLDAKSALTSASNNTPFGADAGVVNASESAGFAHDQETETHEIISHRNHVTEAKMVDLALEFKEGPSYSNETPGDLNSVSEDATVLLKEDHDKADSSHVIVPIENELHCGKKIVDSPAFAECRICQEEDYLTNLESPCACSGSLKFAHRECVQRWCNEKGDTRCEICQKPFEGGYAMPLQGTTDNIGLDLGASWDMASGQPRLFTLATDHRFLENHYDEYAGSHAHSAACFRSVALIVVALLLLRHIISMTGVNEDEDLTTYFMLSLVRAASFLVPCYIMLRAMSALQMRHQQQEASMAAAAEVTHLIQTGRIQAIVAAEL